jgi:hypothetical protein
LLRFRSIVGTAGVGRSRLQKETDPKCVLFFQMLQNVSSSIFVPSGRSLISVGIAPSGTLTANCEGRARLGVKDGDHLPGKTAKELVIGLIPVCRQLTQFFELGLW